MFGWKDNMIDRMRRLRDYEVRMKNAAHESHEKDASSLQRERFEMEGFTPAPRYEKHLRIALLILCLAAPFVIWLLFWL